MRKILTALTVIFLIVWAVYAFSPKKEPTTIVSNFADTYLDYIRTHYTFISDLKYDRVDENGRTVLTNITATLNPSEDYLFYTEENADSVTLEIAEAVFNHNNIRYKDYRVAIYKKDAAAPGITYTVGEGTVEGIIFKQGILAHEKNTGSRVVIGGKDIKLIGGALRMMAHSQFPASSKVIQNVERHFTNISFESLYTYNIAEHHLDYTSKVVIPKILTLTSEEQIQHISPAAINTFRAFAMADELGYVSTQIKGNARNSLNGIQIKKSEITIEDHGLIDAIAESTQPYGTNKRARLKIMLMEHKDKVREFENALQVPGYTIDKILGVLDQGKTILRLSMRSKENKTLLDYLNLENLSEQDDFPNNIQKVIDFSLVVQ